MFEAYFQTMLELLSNQEWMQDFDGGGGGGGGHKRFCVLVHLERDAR